MIPTIWTGVAIIAVCGLLAWMTAWSRHDTWARHVAILLFLLSIPSIGIALAETLGRHKPINWAWDLAEGEYRILAAKLIQDEAIYLYLDDVERGEPRPLVLPWDNETANAIQRSMDGAPDGSEGEFMMSYEQSLDVNEQTFHPIPPPPRPPAKVIPDPGMTYQQN